MASQSNIVVNALEYYDINTEKYNSLFKDVTHVKFKLSTKDTEYNMVFMYDKNKNEIFKSKYEMVGVYNNSFKSL